jgi:hypothetical protein
VGELRPFGCLEADPGFRALDDGDQLWVYAELLAGRPVTLLDGRVVEMASDAVWAEVEEGG